MTYKKTIWKDRVVEKPNTFRQVENPDGTITLYPVTGQVIEKGTPISATNLNKIEDGIEKLGSELDNMITLRLLTDIENTNYKIGNCIMVDYITRLQNLYMAEFYRNLRKGSSVTIACMGDSMTYGHDTTSEDKREADGNLCDDGSKHSFTRASITYPEALEKYLNKIYDNNVTVINRGYSGDYVKRGMERWNKKHNANLTIIMYGTNDSRAPYVPEQYRGNIAEYLKWYEQAIVREILWGKAVVIFIPPKLQAFGDIDIDTFSFGLYQLGEKYNVPVIDTELFTINYNDIHSDGVHFKGVGYELFGAKASCLFIADNLYNPTKVHGGVKLLNRRTIDSFVVKGDHTFGYSWGAFTPSELSSTGGNTLNLNVGSSLTYSFYCCEDDLIIIPHIYTTSSRLVLTLDYNIKGIENSLDSAIFKTATPLDGNPSIITYETNGVPTVYSKLLFNEKDMECLRIPSKGWHTLTIEPIEDGIAVVNGIEFINYDVCNVEFKNMKSFVSLTTHKSLSENTEVSEIRINKELYLQLFKFNYTNNSQYWINPPIKLVITDYLKGSIEYTFTIGNNAGTTIFHGEYKKIGSYVNGRTVSNITMDDDTRDIIISFNEGITNKSNILLKLV